MDEVCKELGGKSYIGVTKQQARNFTKQVRKDIHGGDIWRTIENSDFAQTEEMRNFLAFNVFISHPGIIPFYI